MQPMGRRLLSSMAILYHVIAQLQKAHWFFKITGMHHSTPWRVFIAPFYSWRNLMSLRCQRSITNSSNEHDKTMSLVRVWLVCNWAETYAICFPCTLFLAIQKTHKTVLNCMNKSLSSLCVRLHNTCRSPERDVHAIIPFTRERTQGAIFYKEHITYLRYRPHVLQKRRILCHLVVPVYLQMKN